MFDIQEELKKLPDKPGVYIMRDENNEIIYIGKAVVLKNRVRQYFQKSARHTPKVRNMVARIRDFEYIVTDSELEALILECNLIKKHKPKYNILLKDDKNYMYIRVTMNEEYPRLLTARRIEKDGAKYFGPYTSASAVREAIDLLKKLFPIKACDKVLPRDVGKGRPCLNFHIYQCLGPCQGDINKEEYRDLMKDVCSFLDGKQKDIMERLQQQMKTASENMEFEKAAKLRDKINSIKHVQEKQKVLSTAMEDQDVIAYAKGQEDSCVQVFFIRAGKLIGREQFILEGAGQEDGKDLMASFIKQFYSAAAYVPGQIILQEDIDELKIIQSWLSSKKDARVQIKVPRKGEKLQLVEMVSKNALLGLEEFRDKIKAENEGLGGLTALLGLEAPPGRIEGYDISNTGATEVVGSMVVFEGGLPANKEYRRFKIKSVEGQNDYASMQEMLYRRFKHAEKEMREMESAGQEAEGKFTRLPDLILVDGGLGHVNSVSEVLKEIGVGIPVYGMVKDDRHRTRGLVSREEEFDLSNNLPVLRFVTAIQDEAHRFAVDYNKKLRNKRYKGSVLDEIGGIGPKRKKALLKHFGSVSGIKSAGLDDLLAVDGVNRAAAQKVYDYFHD